MGLLTNISLFSGAGGLDLGAKLVGGFRTVCYVEWDRYAQAVLMSRMRDGGLDEAPLWDDVSSFDGSEWRGCVDVISGGFPCQDLSGCARPGEQRKGIVEGERSGLWKEFARIVGEVGPRFVIVENVPGLLLDGGLGVVLGDLADMGFNALWFRISAGEVGSLCLRERIFVVAYPNGLGWKEDAYVPQHYIECYRLAQTAGCWDGTIHTTDFAGKTWGLPYPATERSFDDVAYWVDRLRLAGNGVVPKQSAPAWALIKRISEEYERQNNLGIQSIR